MPALTHRRVYNGFNQYPQTITYAQQSCKDANGKPLECCRGRDQQNCGRQKKMCCGKPIQPTKYNISSKTCRNGLCRIPNRENSGTDRAIASGGIGSRSFGTCRAIGRRVQNRNQLPTNSGKFWLIPPAQKGINLKTGVITYIGPECEKEKCKCCLPTLPSRNRFVRL